MNRENISDSSQVVEYRPAIYWSAVEEEVRVEGMNGHLALRHFHRIPPLVFIHTRQGGKREIV